jgi:upstream activation factor subunit UAF30
MSFDFKSLEPRIYEIFSAPGTDLSTISAKRVRRQLIELDPTLTVEFFKENREEVDAVIASVFENVSGVQGTEDNSRTDESYKQEGQTSDFPEDGADAAEEDSPPPKKMRKVGKNGRGLSDAELARKLSSEINGRSTRTGGKSRGGSAAAGRKGPRAKKSATTVDSDDDGSDGIGKRKKSSSGGTAKGGFAKEFALR